MSKKLYSQALTHSSYSSQKNYEKLEFIGDAIISSIISEFLYEKYTEKDEGFLTKKREEIVNRKNLNAIGRSLIPKKKILHKLTYLPENIYGNILESIIGALYLDKGYLITKEVVVRHIATKKPVVTSSVSYKNKVLEWVKKRKKKLRFVVEKEEGPDHNKKYLINLMIDEKKISESWGTTIKSAEQDSSKKAYEKIINEEKV